MPAIAAATRYRCPGCGYVYDEARGDTHHGFPPGTAWVQIPPDWACPDCAVNDKADFQPIARDPAPAAGKPAPG